MAPLRAVQTQVRLWNFQHWIMWECARRLRLRHRILRRLNSLARSRRLRRSAPNTHTLFTLSRHLTALETSRRSPTQQRSASPNPEAAPQLLESASSAATRPRRWLSPSMGKRLLTPRPLLVVCAFPRLQAPLLAVQAQPRRSSSQTETCTTVHFTFRHLGSHARVNPITQYRLRKAVECMVHAPLQCQPKHV